VKLTQLAVTAALVTLFSALQAQTVPNPPQKPQSNSLPPPNKSASGAPVAPKATPQSSLNGRQSSHLFTGGVGNDQLYGGYGADASRGDVGKDVLHGDRAIKATPAAPPKSPSGIPVKSSPTQATSVDPPKVDPNAGPASSLGAIHRSNPVIVPPPQPNPTEQSYSRDQGFVSQHGTRPDPRISTVPGSGSSQPVPGRPPVAAQPRPHQGSPFKGSGGDDVLVTGASGGGRPGDAGKDLLSAGQKVTPAPPPTVQAAQQKK
jgi:Ca2+-binding RTX toxin-like protein